MIGIDVRMWTHPGIGRYLRELTKHLLSNGTDERFVFLGDSTLCGEFSKRPDFRQARSKIYSLSEQWEIPRLTRDLDLLHVPHFNIPLLLDKPLVVTVHDLTYLHDTRAAVSRWARPYAAYFFRQLQKKAAAVLTVSEFTRRDLLTCFPKLNPDKVFVTYEAASPFFRKLDDPEWLGQSKKKYGIQEPYVLFVGSLRPHKNIPALINAMASLRSKRKISHGLVLVGRCETVDAGLSDLISQHSFVRVLGEVPDLELVALYNLAELFVLPSFREGFGLPAVEAMACGTPVAVSSAASLPEIVGDAGCLFDPHRVDALEEVIYNVLKDRELQKNMSKAGLERAKQFSWENTARQTRRIYAQVLKESGSA